MQRTFRRIFSGASLLALLLAPMMALAAGPLEVALQEDGTFLAAYAGESSLPLYIGVNTGKVEFRYAYQNDPAGAYPIPEDVDSFAVSIYEKAENGTFRRLDKTKIMLESSPAPRMAEALALPIPPGAARFVRSTREVRFGPEDSVSANAAALTESLDTTEQKAMAVYSFISANFQYDWALYSDVLSGKVRAYTPDPAATLKKRSGICYDLVSLYAAMCRSIGIPTKMIKGQCERAGGYHAWNSVYDLERGSWVEMDITLDLGFKGSSQYRTIGEGYRAESES